MRHFIGQLHGKVVFGRRIRAIADAIAPVLRPGDKVLDIGCGSGDLAVLLMQRVQGVQIRGVDVFVRPQTAIPVDAYDGRSLPYENDAFDAAVISDVLHHADDPVAVLSEASRVCRRAVVIKDHLCAGRLAHWTLSFMDWVGNAPHGVVCAYRYFSHDEWSQFYRQSNLVPVRRNARLGLYPWPASAIFERSYHMVDVLSPVQESGGCKAEELEPKTSDIGDRPLNKSPRSHSTISSTAMPNGRSNPVGRQAGDSGGERSAPVIRSLSGGESR